MDQQQQSRLRPLHSSSARLRPPAYSSAHVHAFPSTSVNPASATSDLSLPNPWDEPQNRPRPRVQSMNIPHNHTSETTNIGPVILDTSIAFPEPQLLQPRGVDFPTLHAPPRNLYHRRSASEINRLPRSLVPDRHVDSALPSYQGMDENEYYSEVR